jgi:hypothetical protein
VADGTIFEKRGIVAAAIVTDPFLKTADSMAKRHGFVDYRYAQMPHPIGNLRLDQIRERAELVLPQVLKILGLPEEQTPS